MMNVDLMLMMIEGVVMENNDENDFHYVNYDDVHDRDHGHDLVNDYFVGDIVGQLLHDRKNNDPNNDRNHDEDNNDKEVSWKSQRRYSMKLFILIRRIKERNTKIKLENLVVQLNSSSPKGEDHGACLYIQWQIFWWFGKNQQQY